VLTPRQVSSVHIDVAAIALLIEFGHQGHRGLGVIRVKHIHHEKAALLARGARKPELVVNLDMMSPDCALSIGENFHETGCGRLGSKSDLGLSGRGS
jgi:hypothetical protein